jgi:Acetyltransferase (GNAT) domain
LSFHVWTADSPEWLAHWWSWPNREPYANPQYVALFEDDHSRALCAAWRSGEANVLYPFLLRDVPGARDATDITSPYGYSGAFCWGGSARDFWPAFDAWAAEQKVVSEFVRFGLFEDELLAYPGERVQKLVNVVRDVTPDEEAIWMDVEHKVRKNVKRARSRGVRIEFDPAGDRLDDFLRLYAHTLDRRDAPARYRFPREFFERLPRELRIYAHALADGRVVSSELLLLARGRAYSFLGGTDSDAFDLRPNDLLKWELILLIKSGGGGRFVLGGGYENDDGIFRYKRSFAPHGLVPFYVGRRVLQPELYRELSRGVGETDFFPAYRS